MKTLYLDCGMGAAGDMLTAALIELLPDPDAFVAELNTLGIPNVKIVRKKSVKCGISGTHISVKVNGVEEEEIEHCGHEHHHRHDDENHCEAGTGQHPCSVSDITSIVRSLKLAENVKQNVLAVYQLIADAESRVHGVPAVDIHFHEIGTMDAIADITAVCLLMDRLAPEQVIVSPVHVGSGHVHCAHGILPVPAPATALILKGAPIYGGDIKGELCTPTGAALLQHFVTAFGDMPVMRPSAIGYGMGKKDFPVANCVRAILGETEGSTDEVCELSCNVDDMTGEAIGFAMDRLFEAGALDVYTISVGMKKSRPGVLICVLCRQKDRQMLVQTMFRCTSTIGIRETAFRRYVLNREIQTAETPIGPVREKVSSGFGVIRKKCEYDDLARIAKERGISLDEARNLAEES